MRLNRLAIALASTLGMLVTACNSPTTIKLTEGGSATVKIGYMNPLTGDDATFGNNYADACQLAIDHINAAGGVNGKLVQLVKGNDQADPEIGVKVAQDLVKQGVVAVVGPGYTDVAKQVVPNVFAPAGVVSINTAASDPALGEAAYQPGTILYRILNPANVTATHMFQLMKQNGHTKITVLTNDSSDTQPFAEAFVAAAKAGGGSVKLVSYAGDGTPDYSQLQSQFGSDSTAMLLCAAPGDGKSIMDDWHASGTHKELKWYFQDFIWGWVPDQTESKFLEGFTGVSSSYTSDTPHMDDFVKTFTPYSKAEYQNGAEMAYDATMLIALAMAKGQANTREAVKANLASVSREGQMNTGWGTAGFQDALAKLKTDGQVHYLGICGDLAFNDQGTLAKPRDQKWVWQGGQNVWLDEFFSTAVSH